MLTYEQKGLGIEFDLLQGSKFPKESLLLSLAVPKSVSHFLHDLYVKSKIPCKPKTAQETVCWKMFAELILPVSLRFFAVKGDFSFPLGFIANIFLN